MFAESMLETSWAQRARRSWTTLTSFGLQALIIGCLLLLPLWKTIGLPAARTVSTPISLGRVAVETAPAPRGGEHRRHGPTLFLRDLCSPLAYHASSKWEVAIPRRNPLADRGLVLKDQDSLQALGTDLPSGFCPAEAGRCCPRLLRLSPARFARRACWKAC